MFTAYRSIRPLAVSLLASAAIAAAAAAPAAAADPQAERAQATEHYLQSFGTPAPQQDQRAQATEQYLQSYGAPEPIAPSVPTSETPWLPIVLAGAFVALGLGAVQMRRVRVRRGTGVRLAT
jgi:TPR repeat protein